MDDSYEEFELGDEDPDPDEMFRGPNDGAYEKEEIRTGPPLDYVAEKFRRSMELTHFLIGMIRRADLTDAQDGSAILAQTCGALRYQLTGYLALKNMLALANDRGFFGRIEHLSATDFGDWLDRIDQQGSVRG